MTPEEKALLEETAKLARENNKILRGIRRSNRLSAFFRIIYWAVIIGSAFGAYYFLQPYVNALVKSYNNLQQNIESVKNVTAKLPALPAWMGGK